MVSMPTPARFATALMVKVCMPISNEGAERSLNPGPWSRVKPFARCLPWTLCDSYRAGHVDGTSLETQIADVLRGFAATGLGHFRMTVQRVAAVELRRRLGAGQPPLLLDVRRSEALARSPCGIADAVPITLEDADPEIPDLPRHTPLVVYCLCSGQASSTRIALRLVEAGYSDVAVLDGGLPAWENAGLLLAPIALDTRQRIAAWMRAPRLTAATGGQLLAESALVAGVTLPVRRDMAVLFVDMVNSTQLLFSRPPEEVLRLVQSFMEVVVDVAVQHCGDVHDFEGDGAMLYFAGPGEAVPAAFELRTALAARRRGEPELPQARFALDAGPLVIGYIGSHERRSLSFIGPSVNTAARILKLAPSDGIVATDGILRHALHSAPDLAARFEALPEKQELKGFDAPVTVHLAVGAPSALARGAPRARS